MHTYRHALMPALEQREKSRNRIKVGLLGCGSMGGDLIEQTCLIPGMEIVAIADRRPAKIQKALIDAGVCAANICEVDSPRAANTAIAKHAVAITQDLSLIAETTALEVVIDATGKPSVGAQHGLAAIKAGKHLVMMNVESDVTVGAFLAAEAERCGVIYTVGAGDEPTSALELVHFIQNMGFQVIAAGKGKNNPLNRRITPQDLTEEATEKRMNPRVLSEFIDGTKTMVEMTALANATGLQPDCAGMHGPACALSDLHKVLIPKAEGGILSAAGAVDYSVDTGVAPGVFAIAYIDSRRLCDRMEYLALGEGPYYTFYRPYHLTSLEVPISVARAALYGVADQVPRKHLSAEACGCAKRPIKKGQTLSGIAEEHYYGWTIAFDEAQSRDVLPLGLLEGSIAIRDIAIDEVLTRKNCQPDTGSALYAMRQQQDLMIV